MNNTTKEKKNKGTDKCAKDYKCWWWRKYKKCSCPVQVEVKEINQLF